MVSARRAARMAPRVSNDEPPEWLWKFQASRWFRETREEGEDATVEAFIKARGRWRKARDAWLAERGLVVYGMAGLTWQEFKEIEQQEPHRVLRRPER
ncbi:hypothetical protein OG937_24415 [Streptomyces sp. NBC_00510]